MIAFYRRFRLFLLEVLIMGCFIIIGMLAVSL